MVFIIPLISISLPFIITFTTMSEFQEELQQSLRIC